jgi:chaperonin GroES
MAVNLTPLHDRVIVKRIKEEEMSRGGIIIPDTAKEKPAEGDRVLFGKYSGSEIKIEGEELLILREEEILAKLGGAAKAAKK